MRLLLDTHTFLWFVLDAPKLSQYAADLIEDVANERFLSIASAWEIAIKVRTGKLTLTQPIDIFLPDQLQRNSIELLPMTLPHILHTVALPFHHRDPFDRLIIAQSLVEAMPVVCIDAVFDAYGVQRFW